MITPHLIAPVRSLDALITEGRALLDEQARTASVRLRDERRRLADSWQKFLSAVELAVPCPEVLLALPGEPPETFDGSPLFELTLHPLGSAPLSTLFVRDAEGVWAPSAGHWLSVPAGAWCDRGPDGTWTARLGEKQRRTDSLAVALAWCDQLERELARERSEAYQRNSLERVRKKCEQPDPTTGDLLLNALNVHILAQIARLDALVPEPDSAA